MGQRRGGPGPFGRGFVDPAGSEGRPFGMARKLSAADLQLLLLRLLDDKPSHGYELIKALQERSQGFYVPSPGVIYPALTRLQARGHAATLAVGQRKQYRLTEAGRRALDERRDDADTLITQFRRVGEQVRHLRRALAADSHDQDERAPSLESPQLTAARRELRAALGDKRRESDDEQLRVAGILRAAAARILGKDPAG